MTDAQRARWALYAGISAVVLAALLMASAAISVTCARGDPNANTIVGPGNNVAAEVIGLGLLLAAILAIILGIQSVRRRPPDPKTNREGVWGLTLGVISVPCCGPLSLISGGFIGVAAQSCF